MEQINLSDQTDLTEELYSEVSSILDGLGYTATEGDRSVLRFCVTLARSEADRFAGREVGAEAFDILCRMALGEFFFFLDGAGRSFSVTGGSDGIHQIREGDVSITYATDDKCSSRELVGVLRGAVKELTAERKLTW